MNIKQMWNEARLSSKTMEDMRRGLVIRLAEPPPPVKIIDAPPNVAIRMKAAEYRMIAGRVIVGREVGADAWVLVAG